MARCAASACSAALISDITTLSPSFKPLFTSVFILSFRPTVISRSEALPSAPKTLTNDLPSCFNRQRRHEQNVFHAVDFNRILRRHTDRKFAVGIRHQSAGVVINRIGSRVRAGGIAAQRHRGQARVDAVELRLNRRIRFGQNRKRKCPAPL